MSIQEYSESLKNRVASWRLKKKLAWATALVLLGLVAWVLIILYYPYSDGTRTGIVRKLSYKGYVFKTWEGELQMSGFLTPMDGTQIATGGNLWNFSVDNDRQDVVNVLKEAESTGKRVTLHYVERLRQFDWRGDTKYFIDGVSVHND
jgi:hypothetical protein